MVVQWGPVFRQQLLCLSAVAVVLSSWCRDCTSKLRKGEIGVLRYYSLEVGSDVLSIIEVETWVQVAISEFIGSWGWSCHVYPRQKDARVLCGGTVVV